jgi:hypothetical protein
MDCTRFEEIVHDIERPGTEGFALRDSALAHAESCAHCARLMTDVESLDAGLRAMSVAAAVEQAPASLEVGLMAEFRRQKMASLRWSVQRQIAALSAAAAVLLAVGFSLHRFMGRKGNEAPVVAKVVNAPSSPAATAAGSGNSQNSVNLIDAADSEYASFVPLPYADDPSALDEGTVVRVEMPRAALASFGLPVAAMESDGTVRADLIVSADGTPQAIRLVPQGSASQE